MSTSKPQPISRATRIPSQVIEQQKRDAERERALLQRINDKMPPQLKAASSRPSVPAATTESTVVPVATKATAVALPNDRTPVEAYLDEVAPAAIVGRMIKFSKEGKFVTPDDDEPITDDVDFIVLADQTLVGWIKFNGEGQPPDRRMGLLFDGFQMPDRSTLGDTDTAKWELGLDGHPQDPWQHHQYLVLQRGDTGELFTFVTSSVTGRRAIGNLLRHYTRLQKTHPDMLPVVKLKVGGFNHRDDRVGWLNVPVLAVVGRAPKDSTAKPNTSPAADLDDNVPF
jgi:hypothetical protein